MQSFEDYLDRFRHFGARMYGPTSPRTHQSPFDHKQIRFMRPFGAIDFVEERSPEDRFTNLARVIDDKLQLELIPYSSPSFSRRGFTEPVLQRHLDRVLGAVAGRPRRYVTFCGAIFHPLLKRWITEEHRFRLKKNDGTLARQLSRFALLRLQHGGAVVSAGLAASWARRGIPMASYGEEIRRVLDACRPDG